MNQDVCDIPASDDIFAELRAKHLCWKARLLAFLDGKKIITEEEIMSSTDCDVGQWLYSEGLEKYKSYPEVKELEETHKQLHKLAGQVVWFNDRKDKVLGDKAYFDMEAVSKKMMALLDQLSQKASTL